MPDTSHPACPQASERRFHSRQQVLYSLMLLEGDNGGVVLNISESGLAMAAVRSLTKDPLHMRFQLSQSNAWIEARGRIAWTNASRQTAGVQFIGLPYEERIQIKRWLSSIDHLREHTKQNPPAEEISPQVRLSPATSEPGNAVSTPGPATMAEVMEDSKQDTVAKDSAGPRFGDETEDFELVSQYFQLTEDPGTVMDGSAPTQEIALEKPLPAAREPEDAVSASELEMREVVVENTEQDLIAKNPPQVAANISDARDFQTSATPAAENTGFDTRPPLYLSYEEAPRAGARVDRERTSVSLRWIGTLILCLFVFFFLGRYFRHAEMNKGSVAVPATASQPAFPTNPPPFDDVRQTLDRTSFVLQVSAMRHKENADALEESLRRRHFPAFVSANGNERFYLVLVGPYSDADSLKAQTDLKEAGFESIRTPWNPSAVQLSHSAGSQQESPQR